MTPTVTSSKDTTMRYEVKYQYGTLDPRLKLLLVAVRRALLILADALKEYYDS